MIEKMFLDIKRRMSEIDISRLNIPRFAGIVGVVIFVVTFVDLFMTITVPVGKSDPVEIYCRNISSSIAMVMLAIFLNEYDKIHKNNSVISHMKSLKIISILLALACIGKIVTSAVFAIQYLNDFNMVCMYHIAEIFVWFLVGLFAYAYYRKTKRMFSKTRHKKVKDKNSTNPS